MKPITTLTRLMILRFLRLVTVLFLLLTFALSLVLFNPHWLLGLVHNALSKQGIDANITDLQVNFSGTTYQLQGQMTAQTDKGIHLHHALITATIDWALLGQGRPFIVNAKATQLSAEIESVLLLKTIKNKKPQRQNSTIFFPQDWQIEPANLVIDGHPVTLMAAGNKDHHFHATISDKKSGKIRLTYSKAEQRLSIESQQIRLLAWTGHKATLHRVHATIDTNNWLNSELVTQLTYQQISSDIDIKKQGNHLDITAKSTTGQSAHVILELGEKQSTVYFDQLDLSIYHWLKPLIPTQLGLSDLSGELSGQITFTPQQLIAAQGQINNLTLAHRQVIAKRINTKLKLTAGLITYQLDLNNSELFLPGSFEQPFSQLNGQAEGQLSLSDRQLTIKQLHLSNQEIEHLATQGHWIWSTDPKKQLIALQGELNHAVVAKIKHYLPKQLPDKTRDWLNTALVSGSNNQTQFRIKGNPKSYATGGLDLQVNTTFKQTDFRFLSDHPLIHFHTGQLAITGRSLQVTTSRATIDKLPFQATAKIEDLLNTVIDIKADIKQQAAEKLLVTAKKTLAKPTIKHFEKHLQVTGRFKASLALLINLSDQSATDSFDLKLASEKATAVLTDYPMLPLQQAKTTVHINTNGLQQLRATGYLQDSQADIAINPLESGYQVSVKNTANLPHILTQLQLLPARVAQWLDKSAVITGQSRFITTLTLDNTGALHTLALQSDLSGTQLNLLSTLKKAQKTRLDTQLNYNHRQGDFSLRLGQINLQAGLSKHGEVKGLLLNNLPNQHRYQTGKIQLYWQSKSFDHALFERFRQHILPLLSSQKKTLPIRLQLHFDAVRFTNGSVYPLSIRGDLSDLHIDSPILSGIFNFTGNHLEANIQTAHLDKLLQLNDKKTTNPAGRAVRKLGLTKALPTLAVVVEQLYFHNHAIGNASLKTSQEQGHYSIEQLLVNGQHFYIEVSGYEKTEPQGMTTHLQADFKGEHLLSVIKSLGLNEVIDAKSLDMSLKLSWPGKLHTLNLQQGYGQGSVTALNLKMLNIDAGVGGVFGLMDITQILKRITLDFKNITTSKIAFDELNGNWNIGGGRAVTRDFHAQGSVIAIKLSGPVDLYRHEFDDLEMIVIPKTSNVLPVIGAVAGGVVGSAIGLAVKQVLGEQIDGIIGLPYIISGPWDNPQLDFGQQSATKNQQVTTHTTKTKPVKTNAAQSPDTPPLNQPTKPWIPAPDWQPVPKLKLESLNEY